MCLPVRCTPQVSQNLFSSMNQGCFSKIFSKPISLSEQHPVVDVPQHITIAEHCPTWSQALLSYSRTGLQVWEGSCCGHIWLKFSANVLPTYLLWIWRGPALEEITTMGCGKKSQATNGTKLSMQAVTTAHNSPSSRLKGMSQTPTHENQPQTEQYALCCSQSNRPQHAETHYLVLKHR